MSDRKVNDNYLDAVTEKMSRSTFDHHIDINNKFE